MSDEEKTLLTANPAMRSKPSAFLGCILLITVGILLGVQWPDYWTWTVFGSIVGALIWIFVAFIQTRLARITITDRKTIVTRGFVSRKSSEVMHKHVRNIQVSQTIFGRLVGVGTIGMSSAGQADVEIEFKNVKYATIEEAKRLIEEHRGE